MEKIKPKITNWLESDRGKDILTVAIVILVGFGSFGLGRLSKGSEAAGIKILPGETSEFPIKAESQPANALSAVIPKSNSPQGKNFFASSRGKKYYSPGCSAGKTIKQENRIYFATEEEAEKAGYELSSSCK